MKHTVLLLFVCAFITASKAQNIGLGTTSPNTNSILDIKQTTNKGLLIPRGDAATRNALNNNTAKGLMLYDTSTNSLWIHNGNGVAGGWSNQQVITSPSIIPYASGSTITLTTAIAGPGTAALVGFGNNISGVTNSGFIDLSSGNNNYAFSMPTTGTITSISAYFSTANTVNLIGVTIIISAQLYISYSPNNIFTAISGTQVIMSPSLTGLVNPGNISNGIVSGLSIPVVAQSRLLLVFSASIAGGPPTNNTIVGYASAGVAIQ